MLGWLVITLLIAVISIVLGVQNNKQHLRVTGLCEICGTIFLGEGFLLGLGLGFGLGLRDLCIGLSLSILVLE